MPLGDFLVAYLQKIGVTHLFGIPGDLVLRLFSRLGKPRGLKIVTLSHEPGVGFAADGYARATGQIGVVCVTYGAGGHNMVNPVAGSFSERVPVLVISGGPGEEERKLGTLIHHQAKEIESQLRIYRELTCAARVIDDAATAAASVDEVVRTVWREQRPGYVEIHRDMVERPIPVPRGIIEWDGALHFGRSDERRVDEAVRETVQRFNAARRPLTMIGIETFRYKLQKDIRALAERMGAPVTTTVLGKGAFPMDHPLFMGVHIGPLSPPPIVKRVERGGGYLAQGYYASMGFGVPGALGAQLGTGARPLVLSGDGAFQMTGPEIAQAPRYGLNPIVLVVNNGGWQIFRPVVARAELLDLPPWPYARLADDWGGRGFYVERVDELRAALAAAARLESFVVIEASVRPDAPSPGPRKYIEASPLPARWGCRAH